jgi:hypothetical protein
MPGYRIFINNQNTPVAYSGYNLTAPANSMGIFFFTGTAWNIYAYLVNKNSIGLGNVDNTSDEDKPVSMAVQEIINFLQSQIDTNAINIEMLGNITSIRGSMETFAELLALDVEENNIRKGDSYIVWTDESWDDNSSLYVYNPDITTDGGWIWVSEWNVQLDAADGDKLGLAQSSEDITFSGGKGTLQASENVKKIIKNNSATPTVPLLPTTVLDFNYYTTPGDYALNVLDLYKLKWKNSPYNMMYGCALFTNKFLGTDDHKEIDRFRVILDDDGSTWQIIRINNDCAIKRRISLFNDTGVINGNGNIWFMDATLTTVPFYTSYDPLKLSDGTLIYGTDINLLTLPGLKTVLINKNITNQLVNNLLNFPTQLVPMFGQLTASTGFLLTNEMMRDRSTDDYITSSPSATGTYPMGFLIQRIRASGIGATGNISQRLKNRPFVHRIGYCGAKSDYSAANTDYTPWTFDTQTLAEIVKENTANVADITLPAGTISMPALVFTSGKEMQNPPVNGALNYDGLNLYFTDKNGVTHQLAVVS